MTDNTEALPPRAQISEWMKNAGWQNSAIRQADLDKVERVVRAALAQRQQVPILQQARAALLEMARGCSSCQDGPDDEFCCRKTQWDAIQAVDALTAAPSAQAEPVAPINTFTLYAELRDLYAEAVAVETMLGRPEVLRSKLAALCARVGRCRAGELALYAAPPTSQAEPQEPLPYGFESGLVQLLNEARCLEGRIVGNRELASRIVDYIRRGIGKQEGK